MAHKRQNALPAKPPEREELREASRAPRLILEISRLLRFRMSKTEGGGVMAQSTARLVLSHLAVRGTAGQLQLVELTRLKPPTVSVLLRRMEEEGYITRTTDPRDRRAIAVTLTDKGRAYDKEHLCRITNNDHTAMRGVEGADEQQLIALLERIRDNLLDS